MIIQLIKDLLILQPKTNFNLENMKFWFVQYLIRIHFKFLKLN